MFANNDKALNVIFQALEDCMINKVSSCTSIHVVWEVLKLASERKDNIERQQLHALQTQLEDFRMLENSPFDKIYHRLTINN